MSVATYRDYSLTGSETQKAFEKGLVSAEWYTSPIPREKLRELMKRSDFPAIPHTLLWFTLLFASGYSGYLLWGSWWAIVPFAIYGVIYASSSDSRWHESGHGTAFRTDWLNNVLYEIASFMVVRESTPWRWSHMRHHSDTLIVGRDPEIAVQRPPNIRFLLLSFVGLANGPKEFREIFLHARGRITDEERTYIPEEEFGLVFMKARIYLLIYATVIALAISLKSILPLMCVGLPTLYGSWFQVILGTTQHAGLAEDVLDHRLNSRTIYMNPVFRFLYWDMNYHVEHHMFPMVPYHALHKLHELMKEDCPPAYSGLIEAYKEIIPTLRRQMKDPTYYVERPLPVGCQCSSSAVVTEAHHSQPEVVTEDDWVEVCDAQAIEKEDIFRYDRQDESYVVYRTKTDEYFASDGYCTHQQTHLSGGFLDGYLIECPKHNGRFDIRDGSVQRRPVREPLKTYEVRLDNGKVFVKLPKA